MTAKKTKSEKSSHHKKRRKKKEDEKEEKRNDNQEKNEVSEKEEELIQEGLEAIYGEEKMDFTKLERSESRITNILLSIVIALAVVAAVAWAGFFVYVKFFSGQNTEKFTIEIEMEENLKSGDETSIKIHYSNPTNVQIASLQLDIRLPKSFQITGMNPLPDNFDEFIWQVGTMPAGSDEIIEINGIWIAEVPSSIPVQVFANYRPSNFNSDFQEIETLYISTTESVIITKIKAPDEIAPGENAEYIITVENTSEQTIDEIQVKINLPTGFYLDSSNPEIDAGENPKWIFENLSKDNPVDISFTGNFAADIEGFQYFDIKTNIVKNGKTYIQNLTQGFTDLLQTNTSFSMVANGSIDNAIAGIGDDLRISLSLENKSDTILDDITLLLDFQSSSSIPIDWSNANIDGGTITKDGIYWSSTNFGSLVEGEKRIINLNFPIDDTITAYQTDNFVLSATATVGQAIIRSSPINVSIGTDANFEVVAKYFNDNGIPLGSGPLPPKSGETTIYRIYWQINNSIHDLENITVEATLPPNTKWMSDTSSDLGTITFNDETGIIRWKISNLSSTLSNVGANFSIEITPDNTNIGKFAKLLSGSTFKATDATTRTIIQNSTSSLTTDLEYDSFADGKGIVIE